MSNYLASVAGRALGTLPVAQPRIASYFENHPAAPLPAFETSAGEATVNVLAKTFTEISDLVSPPRAPRAGAEPLPAPTPSKLAFPERPVIPPARPSPSIDFELMPATAPHRESPTNPKPAAVATTSPHPQPMSPLTPPAFPEVPLRMPTTTRRETNPAPAAAAPVIRVHIGRVEVRAVHSPPAAARPAASPVNGPTSLADYLKQRNGGGR